MSNRRIAAAALKHAADEAADVLRAWEQSLGGLTDDERKEIEALQEAIRAARIRAVEWEMGR